MAVINKTLCQNRGMVVNGFPGRSDHSSEILVARRGRLLGALQVADRLRPEAIEAVAQLHRMGLRVILLTGDSQSIARSVATELGIDEVGADLLPEHKVERIKKLM